MNLYEQIIKYNSIFEEEKSYRQIVLDFLDEKVDHFCRSNISGHITASAFLLNQSGSHFLLMHHRKLNQWFQPGGHLDVGENPLEGAIREAMEESGINMITPVSQDIYDIDVHLIPGNAKEPEHYHYDIRYLLKTGSDDFQKNSESKELRWINLAEYKQSGIDMAPSITRMISKFQHALSVVMM